jgi:hypothetical protein
MNCKQVSANSYFGASLSDLSDRYQWLNHYALFSGGYREDALDCMETPVQKYGKSDEEDSNSS